MVNFSKVNEWPVGVETYHVVPFITPSGLIILLAIPLIVYGLYLIFRNKNKK